MTILYLYRFYDKEIYNESEQSFERLRTMLKRLLARRPPVEVLKQKGILRGITQILMFYQLLLTAKVFKVNIKFAKSKIFIHLHFFPSKNKFLVALWTLFVNVNKYTFLYLFNYACPRLKNLVRTIIY